MPKTITLGDHTLVITRHKLKKWLDLEDIQASIIKAVDGKELAHLICLYVSTAFDIPINEIENIAWYEVVVAYSNVVLANKPSREYPILKRGKANEEEKKYTWEYNGRSWYYICHLFASKYGWDIEYISNLDIDDAIGLIEEIVVEEQLNREWQWGMSEIAYQYNDVTKKSEFKPLPRPGWMQEVKSPPNEKIKLPRSMIPVGIVIRYNTSDKDIEQ